MPNTSPWPMIHTEREALIADLEPLTDEQWAQRSLCGDWTVHQVLGHMVSAAKMTGPRFFGKLIGSGFRFNAMNDKGVANETAGGPKATLAAFKAVSGATTHPPGPVDTMLGEAVVHGEDIRRPLGISRTYPVDEVVRVANFFKGSNLIIGSKKRIAGLRLRATDADWSTGDGPEVEGPALSLLMAMTGRGAALSDLSGEGAGALKDRMPGG